MSLVTPDLLTILTIKIHTLPPTPRGKPFSQRGRVETSQHQKLKLSQAINSPRYLNCHTVLWLIDLNFFPIFVSCVYLDGDGVELQFVDSVLRCRHRLHHLRLLVAELFLKQQWNKLPSVSWKIEVVLLINVVVFSTVLLVHSSCDAALTCFQIHVWIPWGRSGRLLDKRQAKT